MDDNDTMKDSGLLELEKRLSKEGNCRFEEFITLLHKTKTKVLAEKDNDSWYLVYIGTRNEARKRGYARMLIEYVTRQVSDLLPGIRS